MKHLEQFMKQVKPGEEFRYLGHLVNMRRDINLLISRGTFTSGDICFRFGIPLAEYDDFVLGNYVYTLKHVATLETVFNELEEKKREEKNEDTKL